MKKNVKSYLNAFSIGLAVCMASCAHITPIVNDRETASFDGNDDNSGIVQDFENHASEITPHARDRYNQVLEDHYGLIQYQLYKDYGVTPLSNGNYLITAEGKELWYSLKLQEEEIK